MGELWRDLVELLKRRPILWLPVLAADLIGYLVNLGRSGLLRAVVLHASTQHSALGGAAVHAPLSASAMQTATILALLLSWLTYFIRIVLYTSALFATAALVNGFLDRDPKPASRVAPVLGRSWGSILDLALRGLAVYAIAALIFSWISPSLIKHGHTALLRNPWFGYALTLSVLLILSALLPPVALRILSGHQSDKANSALSRQFSCLLVLVASLLAAFVGSNSRSLAQAPVIARYPLEIIGSLVVALPYVLLFTGIALLARKLARREDEEPVSL